MTQKIIKNIRYKRIIDRTTGAVKGIMAYTTDDNFEQYYAAVSLIHKDESATFNKEVGRHIALRRIPTAIADLQNPPWFAASIGVEDIEGAVFGIGLKTNSIIEREKLKYVDLDLIFELLYNKLKIDTNKYR
jgi:hypothetical protein